MFNINQLVLHIDTVMYEFDNTIQTSAVLVKSHEQTQHSSSL